MAKGQMEIKLPNTAQVSQFVEHDFCIKYNHATKASEMPSIQRISLRP